MRITNVASGGATVYITDLKLRIGGGGTLEISSHQASASIDLIDAVKRSLVRLDFSDEEKKQPEFLRWISRIECVEAIQKGEMLLAEIKRGIDSKHVTSRDIPVRPAVFARVASQT